MCFVICACACVCVSIVCVGLCGDVFVIVCGVGGLRVCVMICV